ncbi:hypothetical protein V2J09_007784 [Rumex salicifolius]
MISCEASSSIFKSVSPHFKSRRNSNLNSVNSSSFTDFHRNSGELSATIGSSLILNPKICISQDEKKTRRRRIISNARSSYSSEEEREVWGRRVDCEVEVISWRERRIRGEINVNSDVESVWNALTDYEHLADFIPNLVCSGRIPCPHPGRIWLEQRGQQRALYWHIEARVVLDLKEFLKSVSLCYSISHKLVRNGEGNVSANLFDYKLSVRIEKGNGNELNKAAVKEVCDCVNNRLITAKLFVVQSNERELHFSMVDGDFKKFEGKWCIKSSERPRSAILSYEVNVIPRFNYPAIFLERIIQSDLPVNLRALACQAESSFEKTPITETSLAAASITNEDESSQIEIKKSLASVNVSSKWGVFGNVCSLDKPCMVDEIHLRRFDGLLEDGGVHRFVLASITIKASVREVWNCLTAYESLPEIVPNLAISKVLFRDNNKVRILQEGCKGLLYMVLHARVVMDLCEQLEREVSFEQVEGDFDSFRGKWQLEQLGNHHTMLKYSVESKMRQDTFLSEAIMEEVIYEDLPSNLCAIRDYIEKRTEKSSSEMYNESNVDEPRTSGDVDHSEPSKQDEDTGVSPLKLRPKVPGLQRDIEVLKSELQAFISEYGQKGFMPMRKQLRLHGRVDIEKAITRMGGFRKIASQMNLSLAYKQRKPKGYWDNLDNLQEEINRFQKSWGMDLSYMPSRKSFERAGRYDIARALEKWGGVHEVSRLLSLKLRRPSRQTNIARERKNEVFVSSGNVGGEEKGDTSKPYVSQNTQKWLTTLKELDINWVE